MIATKNEKILDGLQDHEDEDTLCALKRLRTQAQGIIEHLNTLLNDQILDNHGQALEVRSGHVEFSKRKWITRQGKVRQYQMELHELGARIARFHSVITS